MDVNPTEMFDIKVTRQDGVENPADGFPILVMKSAATETPAEPAVKATCDGTCCVNCGTDSDGDSDDMTKDHDESADLSAVRTPDSNLPAEGLPEAPETPEGVTKTSEPTSSEGDDDVAQKIEKAVAEATKSAEQRIEALAAEVAKMRDIPIPGGPMLTATAGQRDTRAKSDLLAKAAYHERQANTVGDRDLARYHRDKAAEAHAEAKA